MRPVNKGSAATNGYLYDGSTVINFGKPPYQKLARNRLGTDMPSVDICADFLLDIVKGIIKTPTAGDVTLKKGIEGNLKDMYKTAAALLLARFGNCCSYCENIITTYLEVEHTVPKAPYPDFTVIWDNFLVCCGPCNQYKGNKPSRAVAAPWTTNPANPTEQAYYDAIRLTHYVWPDLDPTCYNDLPADLWYFSISNNTWQLLGPPDSTDLNNVIVSTDLTNRVVNASISLAAAGMYTRSVQVRIRDNTVPHNGGEMIDLCRLNYIGDLTNTNDRRMFARTQAYFSALQFLKGILDGAVTQNLFDLLWPNYLAMARSSGFYSVFLQLLTGRIDPSGTNLDSKFVIDTNNNLYFPNTNTTNLP